jgi:DNA (cytosine-5)-methyltransferase 1
MGQTESRSVDEPAQTLTTKADSVVVTPFLARTAHGDVDKKGKRRGKGEHSLEEPFSAVLASPDHALVAPIVTRAQHGGGNSSADAPVHTATASPKDQNQVVAAHLMTMRNAQKPFNEADKPTHTICADGARLHLVAAFLAKHFGDTGQRPGSAMDEPVSTITASDHNAVVHAGLINLKGEERRMSAPEAPAAAITAQGQHQGPVAAFLTKYHRDGGQHAAIEEPLHTADCKARFGLCTVMLNGEPWVIVDIGMRMLTPAELFAAQGFPGDYIINRGLYFENGKYVWRNLTATAQVRLVGNSVCPDVEFALIAANCTPAKPARRAA